MAQLGHDVVAFEMNNTGRECIQKGAKENHVEDKISVVDLNLLDWFCGKEKRADFIYMSHISQHFNVDELKTVMINAYNNLKKDGSFAFDALVRQRKNYQKYEEVPESIHCPSLEHYGAASFSRESIVAAAEEVGLKVAEEAAFKEKGSGRAWYEHQNLWGGHRFFDSLRGIERKPVKLTWFVFKK